MVLKFRSNSYFRVIPPAEIMASYWLEPSPVAWAMTLILESAAQPVDSEDMNRLYLFGV